MMHRDPVCGMEVDDRSDKAQSQFNGQTYHFCSPDCKQQFDRNPESYIGKEGQRTQGAGSSKGWQGS